MTRFLFGGAALRLARLALAWVVLFWAIASAMGHSASVVPSKEPGSIPFVLSDELEPDHQVSISHQTLER